MSRSRVWLALLSVLALAGACASAATVGPTATGLATFDQRGLAFEYPAGWQTFTYTVQSSFSDVIAYLATVSVPEPCATTVASDSTRVDCEDRFTLTPDSLVVQVTAASFPSFDITHRPDDATALTIGGLPGYVETAGSDAAVPGVDRTVTWSIAMPGSIDNYYAIEAQMRGPDLGALQAQMASVIASVRYDPPVTPLPTGPGAASTAALRALATITRDDASWSCFPTSGSRQVLVTSLPNGPELAAPQVATCSTEITATPLALWRMDLTVRLPQADPQAGHGETVTVWLHPDGTPGQQETSPIP
ncbi:MAG: hypothetical protein ACHQZR_08680 [Candidatus Limnocylindrales bacterium]